MGIPNLKPLHNELNMVSIVGLSILVFGLLLRVWAIQVLGKFFTATVQIQAGHQLIHSGPYRVLRHPSYAGAYAAYIGAGLLLNAYWGTLIAAVAMFIAYYYRITTEEKALVDKFGDTYMRYRQKTNRMIPLIW